MDLTGYLTKQGLQLSAKLISGSTLEVTRVVAGSGKTGEPLTATSLPQVRQKLAVNTPTHNGNTAVIPATLAAAAEEDYTLTELGVYASDPDKGEILYKVYKLSAPVAIAAGSQMVLRFYLEETVSQDVDITVVCSPAGLITEEDFAPVRATAAASENIQLEASKLQEYLDRLPRLLTKQVKITVSGTLNTTLSISGFYGCGALVIHGTDGFTVNSLIRICDCKVPVELFDAIVQAPSGLDKNGELLSMQHCSRVWLENCTFTGNNVCVGIRASLSSSVVLSKCSISHFGIAVEASSSSVISVIYGETAACSDNKYGAYTYRGGMILLDTNVPDLLGGTTNIKSGGPIFKGDGTLL